MCASWEVVKVQENRNLIRKVLLILIINTIRNGKVGGIGARGLKV